MHRIRQPGQLLIPLLNDTERQHSQIHGYNTPPHALPLTLPGSPGSIAGVAGAQQEPDARWVHDALLHGETLFVVAAGDFEDIAFELGADAVGGDFLAHAAVHEDAEFALVFDFDEFLRAVGGVGYVELHLWGGLPVEGLWVVGWEVVDCLVVREGIRVEMGVCGG